MKAIVQDSLVIHARIVGAHEDHADVIGALPAGWRIERSGPLPTGHHGYDMTRFEIIATRYVFAHENPAGLRRDLYAAVGDEEN